MFKEMTAKDFLSPEKDKFLDLKIQPETKYGEIKVTTPECITVKIQPLRGKVYKGKTIRHQEENIKEYLHNKKIFLGGTKSTDSVILFIYYKSDSEIGQGRISYIRPNKCEAQNRRLINLIKIKNFCSQRETIKSTKR